MTTRMSGRHDSALSAARTGWHKWASRHWGWFVPILAVFGLARGTTRTVRWSVPKLWRAGKWTVRHPRRAVRWTGRRAGAALDRLADRLDQAGKAKAARWARYSGRKLGHRNTVTCAYCSATVDADKAEAHLNAHNQQAQRQAGPTVVPIRRPGDRPSPRPRTPAATAPAPHPTAPTTPTTPTGTSSTGGTMSNNTGTSETVQLMRAANGVGQMDPQSAWELDAQLIGLSRASLVLTENLGQYIETLDRIKVDPRVTAQAGVAVGQVAELVRTFAQTRQLFRMLYKAQFDAAETGVRPVQRKEFFDPRRAA
jgi:hypothetical protein